MNSDRIWLECGNTRITFDLFTDEELDEILEWVENASDEEIKESYKNIYSYKASTSSYSYEDLIMARKEYYKILKGRMTNEI